MTHFCKVVFYNFDHSVGDVGVISNLLTNAYVRNMRCWWRGYPIRWPTAQNCQHILSIYFVYSKNFHRQIVELETNWSKFNFQSKTTVFNLIWILSEISWSLSVWILKCKLFQFRLEIYQKTMSDSMRLFTMLRIVAIVRSQDKKENKNEMKRI